MTGPRGSSSRPPAPARRAARRARASPTRSKRGVRRHHHARRAADASPGRPRVVNPAAGATPNPRERAIAGEDLAPVKARILLMLALTKTQSPAEIQRMFLEYLKEQHARSDPPGRDDRRTVHAAGSADTTGSADTSAAQHTGPAAAADRGTGAPDSRAPAERARGTTPEDRETRRTDPGLRVGKHRTGSRVARREPVLPEVHRRARHSGPGVREGARRGAAGRARHRQHDARGAAGYPQGADRTEAGGLASSPKSR